MLKIGLISDVHASLAPLREALTIFRREGVERILCAGDIAGYGTQLEATVAELRASGCQSVLGNHDLWWLERNADKGDGPEADYLRALPRVIDMTLAGRQLYMVHASPPDSLLDGIRLRDENGALIEAQAASWCDALSSFAYDVLVVGHTHQVFAERLGQLLVINPGSSCFNHTCAVLQLPEPAVQFFPLGGKTPLLAWNWGLERPG
jgi:predicted phosphodiesterase